MEILVFPSHHEQRSSIAVLYNTCVSKIELDIHFEDLCCTQPMKVCLMRNAVQLVDLGSALTLYMYDSGPPFKLVIW